MKQTDIEALLAPPVVAAILARAERQGIADPFAIAIERSGDNVALAAVRVQQLVGLIPTREDTENLRLVANDSRPKTWAERHPEPAPEPAPVDPAPAPVEPALAPAPAPEKKAPKDKPAPEAPAAA